MTAHPPTTSRHTGGPASASRQPSGKDAGQRLEGVKYRHEGLAPALHPPRPERRRGRGPGAPGLTGLLERLSPRDMAVLDLVGDHRFMTSGQLERFCFHDHASASSGSRTARRVLARLERWHLLERPIRRVGGLQAGSTSSIWMLTSIGQRLRAMRAGVGAVGRVRAPGERFIAHYLAVTEAHLALVEAERNRRLVATQVAIEPGCWRHFSGLGGSRETLKPDLSAITAVSREAEFEDHWFIEIDRATESLPTVIRQCRIYEAYRRSGTEQADQGVFPLVVWVVPDDIRAAKLSQAIRSSRGIDDNLYRITTPERLIDLIAGDTP